MNKGKFYGVSVGPGDPQLLTLKAAERIRSSGVLAVPRTADGRSLALRIASEAVDVTGKTIEYLDFLMTRDRAALGSRHDAMADRMAAHLDAGRDVAMLSLGDASLYSSYSYLRDLLAGRGYGTETIPGVTSFCACAAILNRSLTDMDAPLHILPAGENGLEGALGQPGGYVLMKSGGALEDVKKTLRDRGLRAKSAMVVDCGLPTQRIFEDIDEAPDECSYFTTILIAP
jgi:precorrin-2/cobalt-factor-2 C20-methyltransferase